MEEAVRFELTEPFSSAAFKTAGINHSPTLPNLGQNIRIRAYQFVMRLSMYQYEKERGLRFWLDISIRPLWPLQRNPLWFHHTMYGWFRRLFRLYVFSIQAYIHITTFWVDCQLLFASNVILRHQSPFVLIFVGEYFDLRERHFRIFNLSWFNDLDQTPFL